MSKKGAPPVQPFPSGWPVLGPDDRLSECIDYRTALANYDELVAMEGEERVREGLDYLFYFLSNSYELLDEPEFQDFAWLLDPHDYLVYELYDYVQAHEGTELEGIGPLLPDRRVLHMVNDGLERYTTPEVRRDMARRAHALGQRLPNTLQAAMGQAVAFAAEDPSLSPLLVGLLVQSFRRALIDALLDLPDRVDREWEARDRSLDRWREAIENATPEQPAHEAVRALQAAGERSLPQVQHIYYDTRWDCGDEPFREALEVAAAIPSSISLRFLRRAISDCPQLSAWAAEQLAVRMPELACPYFGYLLLDPEPPEADLLIVGLDVIAAARCPDALVLATESLHYRMGDDEATAAIQVAAWKALLALGDPAAVPILQDYLADEGANARARDQLVDALRSGRGGGWAERVLDPATAGV